MPCGVARNLTCMFPFFIFIVGLGGLVALFALKSFELSCNAQTPLSRVRKFGDPLVTAGSRECIGVCRALSRKAVATTAAWVRGAAHNVRASFDSFAHALAARLNRYLRGRRIDRRVNGEPSARLKSVLQKADNTAPPNAL